jgi:hypothetical protein
MRQSIVLIIATSFPAALQADFTCSGLLTDAQRGGFQLFFSPEYSPSLTTTAGRPARELSKSLSNALGGHPKAASEGHLKTGQLLS